MFTIKVSEKKLNDLRMMADWQLKESGYDVQSVNAALNELDDKLAIQKWNKLQDSFREELAWEREQERHNA